MIGNRSINSEPAGQKEAEDRERYDEPIKTEKTMEKIPNIQATKEYQFAKEVENMLNNYSFNHSVFAASIPFMHPTIQQLLYRLIRKCLKVMADEERRYDDRNRASHEEAKAIIEFLAENERYIPHI